MTVRGRLTLWYAGTVALVLLGFAGATWLLMRHQLYGNLDARLHAAAEAIEHGGEVDARELGVDHAQAWREDHRVIVIGGERDRTPRGPVTENGRRVLVRAWLDPPLTVAVASSEAPLQAELRQLAVILGAGVMLAVALAVVGGWLLAAHALAPVDRMVLGARAITAESLSLRLEVKEPRDEIGRLAIAFNGMIARLEASFLELQRFTTDASHELRTPLTALRAVGEVALREDAADTETVASMLEEADRLARLVDGMLELTRAPHRRLEREPLDLAELAREVVDRLRVLADERGVPLEVKGGPVAVRGDRVLLRRAVTNLVGNALLHGGGRVDVTVARNGASASLTVADRGPGIAPEHQERLFERFYRVDAARAGGGTGLGLALALAGVEAHGGSIELESEPGHGSVFRIVLPAEKGTER